MGDLGFGTEKCSNLGLFDTPKNDGHVGGCTNGHFEPIYKGNNDVFSAHFQLCSDGLNMTIFIGRI